MENYHFYASLMEDGCLAVNDYWFLLLYTYYRLGLWKNSIWLLMWHKELCKTLKNRNLLCKFSALLPQGLLLYRRSSVIRVRLISKVNFPLDGVKINFVAYCQEIALFKLTSTKFQPKRSLVCVWYTFEVSVSVVFEKMKRELFRAGIELFYLKYWMAVQIKAELDEVHGESAPSLKTLYFWINEFKRGWTTTKDEARSGRPIEVTTSDMVEKNHHMIMEDRWIKVREISKAVGIFTERVYDILHEKLEFKKVCARWVPRLLTPDQKRDR